MITQKEHKIKQNVWKLIKDYNFISIKDLEEILETLEDYGYLNDEGKKFRNDLWDNFVKETK